MGSQLELLMKRVSQAYELTGWWFGTCFFIHSVGNVIIPTDELIFFRGIETTNQIKVG